MRVTDPVGAGDEEIAPEAQLGSVAASPEASFKEQRRHHWERLASRGGPTSFLQRHYREHRAHVVSNVLPAGLRVLEIGCGEGDLLHAVKPRRGVGIDFSATAIARAKLRFPEMTFIEADANSFEPLGCVFRAIPDTIPL